jgi:hypothetical protein
VLHSVAAQTFLFVHVGDPSLAAIVHDGEVSIACSMPERFLHLENRADRVPVFG